MATCEACPVPDTQQLMETFCRLTQLWADVSRYQARSMDKSRDYTYRYRAILQLEKAWDEFYALAPQFETDLALRSKLEEANREG